MTEKSLESPTPLCSEQLFLQTVVQILTLDVFNHFEEDNSWPCHQILAGCAVLDSGDTPLPGDIYLDVNPTEPDRLEWLKNVMQPGTILRVSANDFSINPDHEQKISFYHPRLTPIPENELDDLILSRFAKTVFIQKIEPS